MQTSRAHRDIALALIQKTETTINGTSTWISSVVASALVSGLQLQYGPSTVHRQHIR